MIQKIQVAIMLLLIPLGGLYWYAERNDIPMSDFLFPGAPVVRVGDIPIQVRVADTPEKRERGLSGREEIGAQGLLFIFDESDYHRVWMKEMLFPIDLIWINEDLEVIAVTDSVRPETYPDVFEPPSPARYLVETEAHFAEIFDIVVGDTVQLPRKYR